jgi:hypothetical protein
LSREVIEILDSRFHFAPEERTLLEKTKRSLSREERRLYFQSVKPREREYKVYLTGEYGLLNAEGRDQWLNLTVSNMLDRGGEPDLADAMVMDLLGRLTVFHHLRKMSEEKAVKLNAMTSFGGVSMVLYLVVIITAIVLYFTTK